MCSSPILTLSITHYRDIILSNHCCLRKLQRAINNVFVTWHVSASRKKIFIASSLNMRSENLILLTVYRTNCVRTILWLWRSDSSLNMHCIIFQQGYHLHSYYERYMTDKETNLYTSNFESKKPDVHSIYRVFREESTILWGSVP